MVILSKICKICGGSHPRKWSGYSCQDWCKKWKDIDRSRHIANNHYKKFCSKEKEKHCSYCSRAVFLLRVLKHLNGKCNNSRKCPVCRGEAIVKSERDFLDGTIFAIYKTLLEKRYLASLRYSSYTRWKK